MVFRKRRKRLLPAALMLPFLLPGAVCANTVDEYLEPDRSVSLEDVLKAAAYPMARAGVESLSWVGSSNKLVYALRDPDDLRTTIYELDITTRNGKKIGEGATPKVAPNRKWVAYVAAASENNRPQIFVYDLNSGANWQLTQFPEGLYSAWSDNYEFSWSRDSSRLLVAHHIGAYLARQRGGDWKDRFSLGLSTAIVMDGKSNPASETRQTQLWLLDIATGKSQLLVTDEIEAISDIDWFPDGRRAAYFRYGTSVNGTFTTSIAILDISSKITKVPLNDVGQHGSPHVSPDGRYIAFDRDVLGIAYPWYDVVSLFQVDVQRETRLKREGASTRFIEWNSNSRELFLMSNPDSGDQWYAEKSDLSGNQLDKFPAVPSEAVIAFSKNRNKLAWAETNEEGIRIRVAKVRGLSEAHDTPSIEVQINENNGGYERATIKKASRRSLVWSSTDGTAIKGLLILPADFKPNKKYPMLVMIHGGPFGMRGEQAAMPVKTPLLFDYWADKQYVIFAPNYRSDGSAGWNAILKAKESGRIFELDFQDIMSGVDEVIRLGIVDPGRMAIMGHSHGATEVNWVITHTDRFRAAVSYEGQSDMMWGTGGRANKYEEWLYGGSPLINRATYDRQSARESVYGVTTPTLFIASEYGWAREQLAWMYAAFIEQGVPSAFIVYRGESHTISRPENMRDVMQRVTDWITLRLSEPSRDRSLLN